MLDVDHPIPGRAAAGTAAWPVADLERRLLKALDFASVAVTDFGETGYDDPVRPALGFGPEKVVAEAAMLAWAAYGAGWSHEVDDRVDALARQLAPLVRSHRALADMALHPDQAFRRVVPHVLLTAMGHRDDAFDAFAAEVCGRVLAHAVDQPATVLAERRWICEVWGRPMPEVPGTTADTVLSRPFDLLVGSREDPYGLTHLLFYVTDFGRRTDPGLGRSRAALLADVEALVLRYLDHGDYDLVGELLMAWPQLHEEWSPVAGFAFEVLAHVEDQVGLLPCGNVDPERLARMVGPERTRYARAASYHTALVMGFLCAATLRADTPPSLAPTTPRPGYAAWRELRAVLDGHPGDWLPVLDRKPEPEKHALAPLLCGLALAQSLRLQDFAALNQTLEVARRAGLPDQPLRSAATDLVQLLTTAMRVAGTHDG